MSKGVFHCLGRGSIQAQIVGMHVDECHPAMFGNPIDFLQPDVWRLLPQQ